MKWSTIFKFEHNEIEKMKQKNSKLNKHEKLTNANDIKAHFKNMR